MFLFYGNESMETVSKTYTYIRPNGSTAIIKRVYTRCGKKEMISHNINQIIDKLNESKTVDDKLDVYNSMFSKLPRSTFHRHYKRYIENCQK